MIIMIALDIPTSAVTYEIQIISPSGGHILDTAVALA